MRPFNLIRFLASGWARLGIVIIALLWLGAIITRATPYYVATNGDETSNGLSWAAAVLTISNGVAKAAADDTVWVSNGTYYLTDQIVITNKITVQSANGWTNTLVGYNEETHTTRCFYVSRTGIVDGFTISNGHYIHTNDPSSGGGGAYVTNGRIQNCYFVNNICSNGGLRSGGGGVYVQQNGIVSNCTFYTNTAYRYVTGTYTGNQYTYSGAICIMCGLAVNCTVISNYYTSATYAGGITVVQGTDPQGVVSNCFVAYCNNAGIHAEATLAYITDCVMSNNPQGGGIGAGIWQNCLFINNGGRGIGVSWTSSMTNCVVVGNRGGGILSYSDFYSGIGRSLTADRCVISNNIITSGSPGGAGCRIYNTENAGILRNCLINNNTNSSTSAYGGGLELVNAAPYTNSAGTTSGIFNCTIVNNWATNSGGGIYVGGTSNYLANCVIAGNTAPANADVYNVNTISTNNFYYCCVNANLAPNQGNITNDPLFANASAGNWRLANNSPCLNKGTNMSWMMNLYDLDGRTRIRYGTVDMGAYEKINEATIYNVR